MRSSWHYKLSRVFSPISYNASSNTDLFSYASVPWMSGTPSEGPSIRLLELAPWRDQTTHLQGRLVWTPLSSPAVVPFKALSYTWGTGGFTSTMYINGQIFKITNSLEQALKHLQRPSESLTLWIDQICINQKDGEEKNEQVAQMGKVYEAAEETLVWLGPAEDNSDLFMRIWREVGRDAENWGMMSYYTEERRPILMRIMNNTDPGDPETIAFHTICHRATSSFTLEFLSAMIEWHKRPWFTRIWVIQEFSLASKATFVCGYQRMSAEEALLARQVFDNCYRYMFERVDNANRSALVEALHALQNNSTHPFFAARQRRKRIAAGKIPGVTLYDVLRTLHMDNKMQATEPCDLIWGVLGLAVDSNQPEFRPDYDRKGQVELAFTRVTKAMIEKEGLDIIALSQFPKKFPLLPSWVPDWSAGPQSSFATPLDELENQFAASKNFPLELLHTKDIKTLGLRGFTIDQIDRIGDKWQIVVTSNDDNAGKRLNLLKEVQNFCEFSDMRNHNIYTSHMRRAEAKWRVPIGDIQYSAEFQPSRAESSYEAAYRDGMIQVEFASRTGPRPDNIQSLQRAHDDTWTRKLGSCYRLSMQTVNNKRPFLSRLGYVGMGPLDMQPEDNIVVFKGARVPFIVRRLEGGKWWLVGECYCHGIMDGENLESRQDEDFYLV